MRVRLAQIGPGPGADQGADFFNHVDAFHGGPPLQHRDFNRKIRLPTSTRRKPQNAS